MATGAEEKGISNVDHHEDVHTEKNSIEGFVAYAEEAHYGYSGARAFFSSPYVFVAALLASCGGFSYGYGMFQTSKTISKTHSINGMIRSRCHLSDPRNAAIQRSIPEDEP